MKGENNKSKSALEREELSVGLQRHVTPKRRLMPSWFVEFGGWIFAVGLLTVVLGTLMVVMWRRDGGEVADEKLASLMVVGAPLKVWQEGSVNKLKSVQVRVGNNGMNLAENIRVSIVLGSNRVQLSGPEQIPAGKSAAFSANVQLVVREGQELHVSLECKNCR
jgi:hypothetical protein